MTATVDIKNGPTIETVLAQGDQAEAVAGAPKSKKKLSVERIYQKKTQHEHILLRPDTYIGSVEKLTQVSSDKLTQTHCGITDYTAVLYIGSVEYLELFNHNRILTCKNNN